MALTLIRDDADRFAQEPLRTEGYALALPAGHRLAGEESVPAEALAGDAMIVRRHCEVLAETSRHFTERGVRPSSLSRRRATIGRSPWCRPGWA